MTGSKTGERDARIVARYADGMTLEEIGAHEGLTRERIRQIVQKHGGADAESAREARRHKRQVEQNEARTAFLERHGGLARTLAAARFSRAPAIDRIKIFYPDTDLDVAEAALKGSEIVFNQDPSDMLFSNLALEAGIWFLLGSELRPKPDLDWAAATLPQPLLDELAQLLTEASVTSGELATILGVIGAAQRAVAADPTLTITGNRYGELRGELLDAMGLFSAKGASPWPPTRQTIMKRYSGWNDALVSMGLAIASKGRQKGLVIFTEDEYTRAVADFVDDAAGSGNSTTFAAYRQWVKSRAHEGERRPSPASVRNFFGTWSDALRVADNWLRDAAIRGVS